MSNRRLVNWHRLIGTTPLAVLVASWALCAVTHHLFGWRKVLAIYASLGPLALLFYAAFRGSRQNPAMNGRYAQWLRRTPWRWGRPLPLGPVRLSLADGLMVLVFAALYPLGFSTGLVVGSLAYGLGYFATQFECSCSHREPILPIAAVFLAGLGIACSVDATGPTPNGALIAIGLAVLVSQFTLPRVLRRFHELELPKHAGLTPTAEERKRLRRLSRAGAPWDPLLGDFEAVREPDEAERGRSRPLLIGVGASCLWLFGCTEFARWRLAGWAELITFEEATSWTSFWGGFRFVCYRLFHPEHHNEPIAVGADPAMRLGITLGLIVLACACLVTFGSRFGGHAPPISLLGRLATGRLIHREYDIIFLAPLASFAVFALVSSTLVMTTSLGLLSGGVALAAALVVLFRLMPAQRAWRLTGHHRIVCSRPAGTRR